MKYKEEMARRASLIEEALDRYLPEQNNAQKIIYQAMRYSLLGGGKRLRGILTISGCLCAGGTEEMALPYACGMEMIHAYSLIHDDLPAMDNDDMRRGKATCHIKFGEANAILAGDALLNRAFELMLTEGRKQGVTPERCLNAMEEIARRSGTEGMIGGQVTDLEAEEKQIGKEELLYLHRHKTGALMKAALLSGCRAGGGTEELADALTEYADKIGLAFQIVDDILDWEGDPAVLGKPVRSDEKNKKSTFVTLFGMEKSKEMAASLSREASGLAGTLTGDGAFLSELALYLIDRKN